MSMGGCEVSDDLLDREAVDELVRERNRTFYTSSDRKNRLPITPFDGARTTH